MFFIFLFLFSLFFFFYFLFFRFCYFVFVFFLNIGILKACPFIYVGLNSARLSCTDQESSLFSAFMHIKMIGNSRTSTMGIFKLQFSLGIVTSCFAIMNISVAWTNRQGKDYITRRNETERKLLFERRQCMDDFVRLPNHSTVNWFRNRIRRPSYMPRFGYIAVYGDGTSGFGNRIRRRKQSLTNIAILNSVDSSVDSLLLSMLRLNDSVLVANVNVIVQCIQKVLKTALASSVFYATL